MAACRHVVQNVKHVKVHYVLLLSEHNNTLTSHCSPSSVADAIDHIAERIVAKAAEQATRVIDMEADRTKK